MKATAKKKRPGFLADLAQLADALTFKVYGCARCGKDHMVAASRFKGEPVDGYNAWASCPTTGDPILIAVTKNDAPPPPPKEAKPMATPSTTSRPATEDDEAKLLWERLNRQKIAEAVDFLTNAGEVSNEVAGGLIQISEQARGILAGPLTLQALLLLLQPRCRKRKNGDPMPLEDIRSVLEACAGLDGYLVAAKGGR